MSPEIVACILHALKLAYAPSVVKRIMKEVK